MLSIQKSSVSLTLIRRADQAAYEQFLSRNNVKDDIVYISVPGQAGLSRIVKLPPVETRRSLTLSRSKRKQQIPFPMNEIVWDFQKIGGGEETEGFALETEVAIFAIKKDVVQRARSLPTSEPVAMSK